MKVALERIDRPKAGWAIFSGCDGEEATFCAFFSATMKDQAQVLLIAQRPDGRVIFDGQMVPALIDGEGVLAADHMNEEEAIAALAEAATPYLEVRDWRWPR